MMNDDDLPELPGFGSDDRLPQMLTDLEAVARGLGLYIEHSGVVSVGGNEVLAVEFLIGDLAFSDAVQNPMQDDVDLEVARMAAKMNADEALDLRARIQQALAEGKNPLELEDE